MLWSLFHQDGLYIVEDTAATMELDYVMVLHGRQPMPYAIYKALNRHADDEEVTRYVSLVGRLCAERILLYRS